MDLVWSHVHCNELSLPINRATVLMASTLTCHCEGEKFVQQVQRVRKWGVTHCVVSAILFVGWHYSCIDFV